MGTRTLLTILLALLLTPAAASGSEDLEEQVDRLEAAAEQATGVERIDLLRRAGTVMRHQAERIRGSECPDDWAFVDCVSWAEAMVLEADEAEVWAASLFARAMYEGRDHRSAAGAAAEELRSLLAAVDGRSTERAVAPMTPCMLLKRDQVEGAALRGGLPRGMAEAVRAKMRASERLFAEHAAIRQDPSWARVHSEQLAALEDALDSEEPWLVSEQVLYFDGFVTEWLSQAVGVAPDLWLSGLPVGYRPEDGFLPRLACEDEPGAR